MSILTAFSQSYMMLMKKYLFYFALLFVFSCTNNSVTTTCTFNSDEVVIDYIIPSDFDDHLKIVIDGMEFRHSYFLDSINSGNYLPKERIIIFSIDGKEAYQVTNKITIASIFARKLRNTGNYKISNGAQVLTQGILKITRVDDKDINLIVNRDYPAFINLKRCK